MLGYPAQTLLTEGATTQLLVTIVLLGLFQLWEAALTCENMMDLCWAGNWVSRGLYRRTSSLKSPSGIG